MLWKTLLVFLYMTHTENWGYLGVILFWMKHNNTYCRWIITYSEVLEWLWDLYLRHTYMGERVGICCSYQCICQKRPPWYKCILDEQKRPPSHTALYIYLVILLCIYTCTPSHTLCILHIAIKIIFVILRIHTMLWLNVCSCILAYNTEHSSSFVC